MPVLAVILGLGVFFGWRWFRDRAERQEALRMAQQGSFSEAEPLLQQLAQRHPRDAEVAKALALGYLKADRLAEAGPYFERWCALRPDDTEPYKQRIDFWMKQQKAAEALADANHVLRLDPGADAARQLKARVLLLLGRYEESERECLRCLQTQPNNYELWFVLATDYHRLGRTPQAVELADRLVRALPNFSGGLKLRGELYLEVGQPEPAIPLFRRAAARPGSDQIPALYQLSLALARAGQDDQAKKVAAELRWRRALETWSRDAHRDNPELLARVVEALQAIARNDEAIHFLTKVLQQDPKAVAAHRLLASCYEKEGQPERAAEHRRRAGPTP